ncbi:MBL fold metallo-hydrolase [Haloimpatiens sp. FM7315]|uniref:MBL fold metallo-hydrolase n=1 Tax=Haloimpatiens sp. FM7315 TaxID=3298609 RepID=UPI00370CB633
MKVCFLGGAFEVGASSILVKINDKNILLDCGIRQGASKDPLPDFRAIQDMGGLDAIIISHAHLDHIGSLPIIAKEYKSAKIYMNNMTKDLTKVLLFDSLKIMNNRESEIPLYAEKDVEDMLNRIHTINYEVQFNIFQDISITFYNAGHIAGASSIYVKSSEGALFYSGDFSLFSQKTVEGGKFPKLRPDVAILESTYGDKLHSNREVEEKKLVSLVSECIDKKGKMLIPAFALGRAQEIILILKKAMNKGELKKINIYVDGMIKDINRVYKMNPLYLKNSLGKKILRGIEPFYEDNIRPITKKEERDRLLESKEPLVVISSSGMLTGGPSQGYAEQICSMENSYIVISGYQDEESPGRKLLNLLKDDEEKSIELNGKILPVKCRVERVGLSAHGDKSEIKAVIQKLSSKRVFLVHGDQKVIRSFSKELMEEYRGRVYTPSSGEEYELEINNPRKQLNKNLANRLNSALELNEENIKTLYEFIRKNYEDKLFNAEELSYIWSGEKEINEDKILDFQRLIVKSPYFESDARRLFLFKARNYEEVERDLEKTGLKPNEIDEKIREYFGKFNYKKSGFKMEENKVILYFDFPKAVDKSIYEVTERFKKDIFWEVIISDSFNSNAGEILIRSLIKYPIKKISYQLVEDKIVVDLEDNAKSSLKEGFNREKEEFKRITSINLEIKDELSEETLKGKDTKAFPKSKAMEQNAAIKYVDEYFYKEEFKPYKKSLKSDNSGRYMELSFITPLVGNKCKDKLKDLEDFIGWRIKISSSCNQNDIINYALQLCMEREIVLRKNPSFNGARLRVTLKPEEEIQKEIFEEIKNKFEHKTGCKLEL